MILACPEVFLNARATKVWVWLTILLKVGLPRVSSERVLPRVFTFDNRQMGLSAHGTEDELIQRDLRRTHQSLGAGKLDQIPQTCQACKDTGTTALNSCGFAHGSRNRFERTIGHRNHLAASRTWVLGRSHVPSHSGWYG